MLRVIILVSLLLSVSTSRSFAALYINEFSSSSSDADWIEIYNSDGVEVDLSNYIIKDSSNSNKLELTGTIPANGFATFDWSDRLNNPGDTISLRLKDDENNIIDQVTYGNGNLLAPTGSQTGGRNQDGQGSWVIFTAGTKGNSNNSSLVYSTPTPNPTSTPTPNPTNTPTPNPTNTPTPKPTNTPTPTKKISPTAIPTSAKISAMPEVMAANTASDQTSQVQNASDFDLGGELDDLDVREEGYNWWKLLIIMGTVIITGAVGVFLYNNHIKERSEEIGNE